MFCPDDLISLFNAYGCGVGVRGDIMSIECINGILENILPIFEDQRFSPHSLILKKNHNNPICSFFLGGGE